MFLPERLSWLEDLLNFDFSQLNEITRLFDNFTNKDYQEQIHTLLLVLEKAAQMSPMEFDDEIVETIHDIMEKNLEENLADLIGLLLDGDQDQVRSVEMERRFAPAFQDAGVSWAAVNELSSMMVRVARKFGL